MCIRDSSESAHAAINPEDGYTFRPQMPDKEGKQQAYGAEQLSLIHI